ncbi:MAG: hypothetical protein L0Z70_01900 [Chloroflexi bacterium]|nr:hypothetical protein [Chloroflexota bacterium]
MSKDYTFLNGDIVVTVPETPSGMLRAVKLEDLGSPDMNPTSGDFEPNRVLANIVLESVSAPGQYLTNLGQTVTMKVKYTAADKTAAGENPLALAFWEGSRWVRFTAEKHKFALQPLSAGGVATVEFSVWGDPAIAWGNSVRR